MTFVVWLLKKKGLGADFGDFVLYDDFGAFAVFGYVTVKNSESSFFNPSKLSFRSDHRFGLSDQQNMA
jgi:hypothetical protein